MVAGPGNRVLAFPIPSSASDVYFHQAILPNRSLIWNECGWLICLDCLGMSFAATLYPAWRHRELEPSGGFAL